MFEEDEEILEYFIQNQKEKEDYLSFRSSVEYQINNFNVNTIPPNEPDFKFEYAMEHVSESAKGTSFRIISSDID